ncbi:hypothetical protein [Streptomyces sp. NPDC003077]|uniref:hypothetical protein n=1 Tax=Streptomyces sp. NPDC003077 TaxID=3154443 RepID=UPI0033A9FD70
MTWRKGPGGRLTTVVRDVRTSDSGQVTAFVVACAAGLFLFAGLVLDGGLALAGKVTAADVAQEAARVGTQHLDLVQLRTSRRVRLDRQRAVRAALDYIRASGNTGQASAGERYVTVNVTHRQRTQILSLAGIDDLVTTASATARAEQGISAPWQQKAPR